MMALVPGGISTLTGRAVLGDVRRDNLDNALAKPVAGREQLALETLRYGHAPGVPAGTACATVTRAFSVGRHRR